VDAGIYGRLSYAAEDDDQVGTPVDRQVADCLAYAKLKGWNVVRVYRDEGLSGYTETHRPEFERMLGDAQAGVINAILTWKLDRLSRNRRDWNRVIDLCDQGLILASVTESLDSSTATGEAMRDMIAIFARMESRNISLRTQAAFAARARAGVPRIAGRRPFGRLDDRSTPHPEEATELRSLAYRLLAGESIRGLCLDLNRREWTTTYGKPWTPHTLRRVLTSPGNVGDLVHRGQVAARQAIPPILDPDVYQQVCELLAQPGRRTHHGRPRRYLLVGGLARCWCGNALVSRPEAGGWRRYICLKDGKVHLSVTADGLEKHVENLALTALTGPRLRRALARGRDAASAELARSLAADETALAELREDYYQRHLLSRGDFLAYQLALRDGIDRKREQLARRAERRILAEIPAGKALRDAWERWDLDRRRSVLDAVFVSITVKPGRRGARSLDPDRVDPEWRI